MYQTALDKACFQHDMTYGDLKKKDSDKILHDKAFNIAKNARNDGYRWCLASALHKFEAS